MKHRAGADCAGRAMAVLYGREPPGRRPDPPGRRRHGSEAMHDTASGCWTFESIRFDSLDKPQRYKLFMGTIIPRPIAFVSSLGPNGVVNAAPFSNFISLSATSSLLGFSVAVGARGAKDTLVNIEAMREFVINTVPVELAHQVQASAQDVPSEVSEVDLTGLGLLPSTLIRTPRIAQTKIQLECELYSITEFETARLIAGRVVMMHARTGLVHDHKVDPRAYDPLGRLGGRTYCRIGDIIDV
jgi:flavin reductase (DIM6/NTAB) family NADH-FMN oxidoreductase RutF